MKQGVGFIFVFVEFFFFLSLFLSPQHSCVQRDSTSESVPLSKGEIGSNFS